MKHIEKSRLIVFARVIEKEEMKLGFRLGIDGMEGRSVLLKIWRSCEETQ